MSDTTDTTEFSSPYRLDTAAWGALVTELGADKIVTKKARVRAARKPGAASSPASEYSQDGGRSAWEIALELAGRLGRELGDGKFAVWCINDAAHSNPDGSAEAAGGSCVLLPPAQDSIFGLPKCSHGHCQKLTLRQWIAAVGFDQWAEAMLRARGWRRAREFLLHDEGISGWKRVPFLLRDHEDTVDGGPYQFVPDEPRFCDFTARIVADVEEHDVSTSRRWYEIEATVEGRHRTLKVAASEFTGMGWVSQLGAEAVIEPGRDTTQRLRAGIQYLSKPVLQRDSFTFVGFRKIRGQWVYLNASGGIGADGFVDDITMSLGGDVLPKFALPSPPIGAELAKAVRASAELFKITEGEVSVPVFGAVWRAPLGPSPLTVYVSAPPETGKSLVMALAQQHFGPAMHESALPASVKNATAASVNELRAIVGDAVFVYDDFKISGASTDDIRLSEKVDSVVRAQYGGTGAQRLSQDGKLRSSGAPPRSVLLMTGETVPNGHSLRTRLLVADMRAIQTRLEAHKAMAASGVYAQAMSGYVKWLAPQLDEVRAAAKAEALAVAAKLVTDGNANDRTVMLLAEVAVGVSTFLRYAVEVEALTVDEARQVRRLAWSSLRTLYTKQEAHRVAQDPLMRFCDLLGSALSAGRCHVTTKDGSAPRDPSVWGWRIAGSAGEEGVEESEEPEQVEAFDDHPAPNAPPVKPSKRVIHRPMGDCLGVVDLGERRVWVKADIAYRAVREMAASIGAPLALTAEDLPKRLFEKGLLAKSDAKRDCYTCRGPKGTGYKGGYLCFAVSTLGLGDGEPETPLAATEGVTGSATDSENDE